MRQDLSIVKDKNTGLILYKGYSYYQAITYTDGITKWKCANRCDGTVTLDVNQNIIVSGPTAHCCEGARYNFNCFKETATQNRNDEALKEMEPHHGFPRPPKTKDPPKDRKGPTKATQNKNKGTVKKMEHQNGCPKTDPPRDREKPTKMSVGLQRRVPALDETAGGVPAAWKSGNSEPPFPSFAPPAGSPAGPAFAASPAPSTPGPGPGFAGPYAAPGPFGSPVARPGSGGGFPPGPPPQQAHFPGPGFAPPGSPFHPHPPHPPMPHPHMMAPLPPPVDRRHAPYFGQPDYRVYELNKRLQQRTEDSDNLWWDAFATEFFEDDATLTLTFCLEDGPKRYTIGRTLIPRYFRSIYEGGVSELYYTMRQPKESFHNTSITLDCDHCTMVTHHGKPMFTKVCTEGRLILEFTFDDLMRIKSWHMAVRAHRELIPRQAVHPPDHASLDQLSKNITRQGITNSTLNYLRLCVILEPMQELMSRHKAYALSPRDCLKTTLFQKWQRMVAPPESQRPASKRRKRKGSAGANAAPPAPAKKRSPGPNFSLASQDVMVVGEPSLMGGEFGDEDERLITRLENTQYEGDGVEWSAPPPASPAKTPPGTH